MPLPARGHLRELADVDADAGADGRERDALARHRLDAGEDRSRPLLCPSDQKMQCLICTFSSLKISRASSSAGPKSVPPSGLDPRDLVPMIVDARPRFVIGTIWVGLVVERDHADAVVRVQHLGRRDRRLLREAERSGPSCSQLASITSRIASVGAGRRSIFFFSGSGGFEPSFVRRRLLRAADPPSSGSSGRPENGSRSRNLRPGAGDELSRILARDEQDAAAAHEERRDRGRGSRASTAPRPPCGRGRAPARGRGAPASG